MIYVKINYYPFPRTTVATTYDLSFESLKAYQIAQIDPMKVKVSLDKERKLAE